MTAYAPDDQVTVSPRYMAGAGDRLADAIGPLIHLFGWPTQHDAATGHVKIDSPDGSVFCDFAPLHPLGTWWTIAHHKPYWEVQFSRQTPMEAVAAVTQALPQLLGDHRHAERIPITDMPLDQIAALNDWTVGDGALASPDWYCQLIHTPDEEVAWRAEHVFYEKQPLATFTREVPEGLVRNFSAHLATPTAVQRAFADVPLSTRYEHSHLITPARAAAISPRIDHTPAPSDRPGQRR
ncbi:SPDY domain-containing protein [Streptomyces sp. DB-54]